jgi:hypothetical protein
MRLLLALPAIVCAACTVTNPTPFANDAGSTTQPGSDASIASDASAGSPEASTGVDASAPDTGPLDCDPDPTQNCGAIDISQVTPIVDTVLVGDAGTVPTMTGGTIVPGDYQQTSSTYYVPDVGPTDQTPYQTIWRITTCGRVVFSQLIDGDSGPPIITATGGTFTTQGTSWTETGDCPDPNLATNVTYGYTATATTLTFLETTKEGSHAMVFQKM